MSELKVAHISYYLELGGAERNILDLCIHGREHQVVVALQDGRMRPVIESAGVELRIAQHPHHMGEHLADCDLINIHWPGFQPELYHAALEANKPFVCTLQWRSVLPPMPGPVICTSQNVYDLQLPNYERRVMIPNGVDTDKYRPSERPDSKVRIVRVCHPHKCAEYFWPGVMQVLESCLGAELLVIGGPAYQTERIRSLGYRTDVPDILSGCDVFAYTPHPYVGSFDLVVLEAMACGLPCVVSDVPCVQESVLQERTGLLTPYEDVEAFAQALLRVVSDKEYRETLGEEAIRHVRERYDIRDIAGQYSRVYELAVNDRELPRNRDRWLEAFQSGLPVESVRGPASKPQGPFARTKKKVVHTFPWRRNIVRTGNEHKVSSTKA